MDKKISKQISPLRLINDEPIKQLSQDWLNMDSWARVIASVALGTEGPFTVGVFGQWGEGKTSILQRAKKLVDDSKEAKSGSITTV
ncbi:MAG: hypothetical protein KAR20_23430, partial [Candidatus Heimdallarchaeota archaeon]|nr:hypothetical protein [Candidatus Heimdallarchaeota archaeon]